MNQLTRCYMVLLLMALLGVSVTAAQTPTPCVKLVQAQSLADVSSDLQYGAMSPDGSFIAWVYAKQLCLFTFASSQKIVRICRLTIEVLLNIPI